jgi:diguanylate cyclase (GGDEF)-like protein
MLLAEQTVDGAIVAAERLRAAVEALRLPHPTGGSVTVSAGVASLSDELQAPEEIFELADQALYRAKGAGRNRVMASPVPGDPGVVGS